MNEVTEKKVVGLENKTTTEVLQTIPEQSIGEVMSDTNSQMEDALKEAQTKIASVEKEEGDPTKKKILELLKSENPHDKMDAVDMCDKMEKIDTDIAVDLVKAHFGTYVAHHLMDRIDGANKKEIAMAFIDNAYDDEIDEMFMNFSFISKDLTDVDIHDIAAHLCDSGKVKLLNKNKDDFISVDNLEMSMRAEIFEKKQEVKKLEDHMNRFVENDLKNKYNTVTKKANY